MLSVGSLFSGVGGMDAGLHRAGYGHAFFCESDPWRREVLAARWPGIPIYTNVRDVALPDAGGGFVHREGRSAEREQSIGGRVRRGETAPDLLCGGFPCQDLSVAGKRAGLDGERSGLFFEFARIIDAFRPRWVLVENVPGLLSSNGGRDFGVVLGTLADLGYGVGWRVLDSRFFGVPQRRRRVFIVGAVADGDSRAAAGRAGEVLAVGSRCPGHPPTRTEAGQDVAVASLSGIGSGGPDDNDGQAGRVIVAALTENNMRGKLRGGDDANIVAFHPTGGGAKGLSVGELAPGIGFGNGGQPAMSDGSGVRRLTPRECERLQGLPDDWTRLNAKTPDSRRYSALGDAVTANVAEWLGRRILEAAA